MQRPDWPRININAPLAGDLLFAGLGGGASSLLMADASGWGNNGTLTNMDPPSDWVFDPYLGRFVLEVAGSNQSLSIPASVLASVGGGTTLSISAWFKPTSIGYYTAFCDSGTTQSTRNAHFGVTSGGSVGWVAFAQPYSMGAASSYSPAFTAGEWQHIVFQCSGTPILTYRNGVQNSSTAGGIGAGLSTTDTIEFGDNSSSGGSDYVGKFADVLIFKRLLSLAEIQGLADPSNVMLSGLILPPTRKLWPVAAGAPAGISAIAACVGTNATVSAAATVRVAAAAATTGTAGTAAAVGTVRISASGAAVGITGTAASATTVGIAATSASVGINAATTSAATVAITAAAVCVGANAAVVARIGQATGNRRRRMLIVGVSR